MRMKVALAIYLVVGTVNIALGLWYFLSTQFMSYHAHAVGVPWQELDAGVRTLILALMKVAGGGWLALGLITIILAASAFKTCSLVARWTLPIGTIALWLASFAATWGVYQATGAPTPWGPSIAMIACASLALFVDAPWQVRHRP